MPLSAIQNPFLFLVFGASGDLAKLKIFPSLYTLLEQQKMPADFRVLGFARSEKTQQQFQQEFRQSIEQAHGSSVNSHLLNQLSQRIHYFQGGYDQLDSYQSMRRFIAEIGVQSHWTKIAYFSVPPKIFHPIIDLLYQTRESSKEDVRLVLEKPFGSNEASADQLFHYMLSRFSQDNIFLLDHYLGKTGVQSLLTMRHANPILNQMLSPQSIANIQITAWEDMGVDNRIGYFEQAGTIKDMIQSHLLQVLSLLTMNVPITEEVSSVHRERNGLISSLFFPNGKNLAIGQYEGYRAIKGVKPESNTETYAAVRLMIDQEAWHNVPIYLRTGKQLEKKATYVVVEIKPYSFQLSAEHTNRLVFEIQPDERVSIHLVNHSGHDGEVVPVIAQQSMRCVGESLPEHAQLLLNIFAGRRLHFLSFPEIIAAWRLTDQLIQHIQQEDMQAELYSPQSSGPTSQHQLVEQDGFHWHNL